MTNEGKLGSTSPLSRAESKPIKTTEIFVEDLLKSLNLPDDITDEQRKQIENIRIELSHLRDEAIHSGELLYDSKGSFLHAIAVNGSISNLDEEAWLISRLGTFQKWFAGSILLDENQEPIVYFHASKSESLRTFQAEKEWTAQFKESSSARLKIVSTLYSKGIYFTSNSDFIGQFSKYNLVKKIYKVFLKSKNPKKMEGILNSNTVTPEYVKGFQEQGYDAFITDEGGPGASIIVFEPDQIKAVSNVLFSNTEDIYF